MLSIDSIKDRRNWEINIEEIDRRSKNLSLWYLMIHYMNLVDEILSSIDLKEMPIFSKDWKVLKYEILSFIEWKNTEEIMKEIDSIDWKSKLFKNIFPVALKILGVDKEKNISINIWTKELLDIDLVDYLCENNKFSDRITLEVLEEDFEWENSINIILQNLKFLKEAWYKIVIDDFWKEFSNKERVELLLANNTLNWVKLDWKYVNFLNKTYKGNPDYIFLDLRYLNYLKLKWVKLTGEYIDKKEKFYFARDILELDEFQWKYMEERFL